MSPRKRRVSPLPLIGLSFVLLLVPARISQKVRLTALSVFLPFHALAESAARFSDRTLSSGEGQELRTRVDYLQDEIVKLMERNEQLKLKLAHAAGMKQYVRERNRALLFADVLVPTDSSQWRKSLTLALGHKGGVEPGMLVTYNSQLVGRVAEVARWTSRVQLVTDPGFRVGAVAVPKTYTQGVAFEKRHIGVYEGTAGELGQLKWITGDTPVENGAYVITTEDPLNDVPQGLILGRVTELVNERSAFPRVKVEPVLNFGALEHVMLLFTRGEEP